MPVKRVSYFLSDGALPFLASSHVAPSLGGEVRDEGGPETLFFHHFPMHCAADFPLLRYFFTDTTDAADRALTPPTTFLPLCARMNCNGICDRMQWTDERRTINAATSPRSHNPPNTPAPGRDGCAPLRPLPPGVPARHLSRLPSSACATHTTQAPQ